MADEAPTPVRSPLAYNKSGEPVQLDPSCVAFRVVYANSGTKVAVQARIGGPLYIDLTTSLAELREQTGAGKFVLLQVDDDCQEVDAEPSYVEFGLVSSTAKAGSADSDKLIAALLDSNKVLREGNEALTKALKDAINSLTGHGVTPPKKKDEEPEKEEPAELDIPGLIEKYGPLVMMVKQLWQGNAIADGSGANGSGTGAGGGT